VEILLVEPAFQRLSDNEQTYVREVLQLDVAYLDRRPSGRVTAGSDGVQHWSRKRIMQLRFSSLSDILRSVAATI
jgi:hypothetical protein